MADPRQVAVRRQVADLRLKKATEAASEAFGLRFRQPSVHQHQHPDLYAAEQAENVAEFIEQVTASRRAEARETPARRTA